MKNRSFERYIAKSRISNSNPNSYFYPEYHKSEKPKNEKEKERKTRAKRSPSVDPRRSCSTIQVEAGARNRWSEEKENRRREEKTLSRNVASTPFIMLTKIMRKRLKFELRFFPPPSRRTSNPFEEIKTVDSSRFLRC